MTIVASNSLTISNVNDGTITHTAYAYSVDGTDGFTTVYPNLNLLNFNSGVTFGKYYGWGADVTSWSGYRAYFKKVKVTPNNKYTISANWSNTEWLNVYGFTNENDTTAIARYGSAGGLGAGSWDSNFVGGYSVANDMTFTVPANVNYIGVSYASISRDTLTLQALLNGKPKLEQGSTATPWMPSVSEAKTTDYPSYRGEYSDFSDTASTDPSKYSWGLIKGSDSYTHTAYSWSADGKDGFTTVYPNLNLIENGKFAKTINSNWHTDGTTISKDDITDYFKVKFNGTGSLNRIYYGGSMSTIPIGQKYSVYIKAYSLESSLDVKIGTVDSSQGVTVTNNNNILKTYKVEGLVRGNSDTLSIFGKLTTTLGTLLISEIKVEEGSTSTPWMPLSSEVKTSDYPNYIGTYSDSNVEASLDYSKYQWAIFKGQNSNAYTAYSWSSDGTDRFSTVYPNLNLLINSRLLTRNTDYAHWEPNNSTLKIIQNGLNVSSQNINKGSDNGVVQRSIPFSVGKPITISCWVTNNSDVSISSFKLQFRFDAPSGNTYPSKIFPTVLLKGNRTKFEYTYVVPSNTTLVSAYFLVNSLADSSSFNFDLTDMKAEQDSIATPWTPSESEVQEQWQDAIPMYVGVGEKDSQNPSDYRWQLNPRYVQASSDSGLSNKAGVDDLASVANTANDALVQAQNAVSNEDYTSWLEHDYQTTINNLQDVSAQNQEDINSVDDRTTIVEGFYGEMKVKWNFIDESFTFSEEGMFISNAQSKMAIQVTSDKIVFWDNNVDVAFITGEVLNIQKGVFLESATIGNHLITKFSNESPVTIIRYVGGIT